MRDIVRDVVLAVAAVAVLLAVAVPTAVAAREWIEVDPTELEAGE